jgi:hypothetical protein
MANYRLRLVRVNSLKLRVSTRIPASLVGQEFITITRGADGKYNVNVDYSVLTPGSVVDPTTANIAVWDVSAGVYKTVTLASLLVSGLDADLQAIAALTGTGILSRTADGAWALRTLQAPAAGITITNPGGVAGNETFALANDLAALEGLSSTGLARRTGTDTWTVGTTVSVPEGGTGLTSVTSNAVVIGAGTSPLALTNVGISGQILLGSTGAAPGFNLMSGDATIQNNGTLTIANNAVSDAKFRQSAGLSVVGRSANTTGNTADITGTAGQVLRVSGTTLGFGAVDLSLAAAVTNTLAATNGGTGQSSYAVGDLLYASTTSVLSKLADVATGNALISGGVGVAPSYGKIGLTTHVSGTLPLANGGWPGGTSATAGGDLTGTYPNPTVANSAITNAKRANMAAYTLSGNATGSSAVPTDIDVTALTAKASPVSADIVLIQDSAASNAFKKTTVGAIAATGVAGVASVASQSGALTIPGGSMSSTALSLLRYDAAQALTLPNLVQAQANINLPAIHRRPVATWLPKWGAARAKVLANTSNAKILVLSDSTGVGYPNTYPNAWPTVIASLLTSAGINASSGSRIADGGALPNIQTYDTRVVAGGSYAPVGAVATLGGGTYNNNSVISTAWTFTPTTSVDSFDFYSLQNTGHGTMSIAINGGSATSINANGSSAVIKTTKTSTLGASTFQVTPLTGNTYFIGVIGYNSAVKEVSVLNASVNGATMATFANNGSFLAPIAVIGNMAPDLTIIDCTVNDSINGTSLATYQTNLQAVIDAAKVTGDVILLGGAPVSTISMAAQVGVNSMLAAVAAKNSMNYISMLDLWQTRAAMVTAGYDAGDGVHITSTGLAAQAALLAPILI